MIAKIGRPRTEIAGRKFNRLLVLDVNEEVSAKASKLYWNCLCDCGNKTIASANQLVSGRKKSCGCLKRETAKPPVIVKHGLSYTRLYQCWKDMKGRCYRPTSERYCTHGARGIKVCEEWLSFEPFRKWAVANGYRDDLTIDRIDNDGNYEPSNCRWATMVVQGNNRRTNKFVEYNGERLTIAELARKTGIRPSTLRARLNRGATTEVAVNKKRYKKGEIKNGILDL